MSARGLRVAMCLGCEAYASDRERRDRCGSLHMTGEVAELVLLRQAVGMVQDFV